MVPLKIARPRIGDIYYEAVPCRVRPRWTVDEPSDRERVGSAAPRHRRREVALMYRTANVARLAGALFLPVFLATGGLLSLLAVGETTTSTWAFGLAVMFPVSAGLLGLARTRSPLQSGSEHALGLVAGVVTLSTAYLGAAATAPPVMRAVAGVGALELLVTALVFSTVGGTVALVDARYVERPETAARLEAQYLDDPVRTD